MKIGNFELKEFVKHLEKDTLTLLIRDCHKLESTAVEVINHQITGDTRSIIGICKAQIDRIDERQDILDKVNKPLPINKVIDFAIEYLHGLGLNATHLQLSKEQREDLVDDFNYQMAKPNSDKIIATFYRGVAIEGQNPELPIPLIIGNTYSSADQRVFHLYTLQEIS